jgi:putative restriction endonuclease
MNAYIANTDYDWYKYLSSKKDLDEANFWRPTGNAPLATLSQGEPLFFKLKKDYGNRIVGFGLFVLYKRIKFGEAWEVFGNKNGAESLEAMWHQIAPYAQINHHSPPDLNHEIGCILLTSPIFFPEEMWIQGPNDWSFNLPSGKYYDTTIGEGKRIFAECMERVHLLHIGEQANYNINKVAEQIPRYGLGQVIYPRLGQGSFRFAVEQAYQQCAVTKEHSIPALEAAHIKPYSLGGFHEVNNGLLLRADIHKLFDKGYVTITPDYYFKVSEHLKSEYHNGKIYYEMNERKIWLPDNPLNKPNQENLEYHQNHIFLR